MVSSCILNFKHNLYIKWLDTFVNTIFRQSATPYQFFSVVPPQWQAFFCQLPLTHLTNWRQTLHVNFYCIFLEFPKRNEREHFSSVPERVRPAWELIRWSSAGQASYLLCSRLDLISGLLIAVVNSIHRWSFCHNLID